MIFILLKRRWNWGAYQTLFFASCVLFAFTKLPYWHGFILNLGEVPTALCILLVASLYFDKPVRSFKWMVYCAWFGKILYLPLIIISFLPYFLLNFKKQNWNLYYPIRMVLYSISPLALLVMINFIFYGWQESIALLSLWKSILFSNSLGGPAGEPTLFGLSNRLAALEWQHYSLANKLSIVGLYVLGGFCAAKLSKQKKHSALLLGIMCAVTVNYLYYFFWHPTMWIRYLQPALFVSFSLIVFTLSQTILAKWLRFDKTPTT